MGQRRRMALAWRTQCDVAIGTDHMASVDAGSSLGMVWLGEEATGRRDPRGNKPRSRVLWTGRLTTRGAASGLEQQMQEAVTNVHILNQNLEHLNDVVRSPISFNGMKDELNVCAAACYPGP